MMVKLLVQQRSSLALSNEHQQRLSRKWDRINGNEYSFVTRERRKRGGVTLEEIARENGKEGIGGFAVEQVQRVCRRSTATDIVRRLSSGKKFLAVGYGQGWDRDWLSDVTEAGLETSLVEVAPVTCLKAEADLSTIWNHWWGKSNWTAQHVLCPAPPTVIQGEIRSVLLDPSGVGLDLDSVEIFYLCRTLFALSKRGAKITLQIVGESLREESDPGGHKRVILINPLSDDNPGRETESSISLSRNQILRNIRRGADRPLLVEEAYHRYYDRLYTAMIIKAK